MVGGTESRKSLVPLLWGGLGLLMRIGMGQARLSLGVLCRHTADNVADGSSRLPSEGG